MTAYATRAELYSLAVPSVALAGISTAQQDDALLVASQQADSYLNARLQLPLTAWGSDLKMAVCRIAAYNMLSVRGFNPESGDAEIFLKNHDASIKWLEQIMKGGPIPAAVVDSSTGGNNTNAAGDAIASNRAFVVQTYSQSDARPGDFWERDEHGVSGGIGPPRRRW